MSSCGYLLTTIIFLFLLNFALTVWISKLYDLM